MRTALVTGAGRGIGKAISLALAREGVHVALLARTQTEITAVAETISGEGNRALPVVCDVTDPKAVASAVGKVHQAFGSIAILINNAGYAESEKFLNHNDEVWRRMLEVNLNSVYYVTKSVLPIMVAARYGRIINIASISAKVGGKYVAAYTAAKHAVLGLTRALAVEFVPYNITVNAVCPGYVATPLTEHTISNIADRTGKSKAEAQRLLEQMNPLNRLITPEEVAVVAVMLAGENAGGITGQAINVDGGTVVY